MKISLNVKNKQKKKSQIVPEQKLTFSKKFRNKKI